MGRPTLGPTPVFQDTGSMPELGAVCNSTNNSRFNPPMTITPEMKQWLTNNREDYEFYMLHALLHNQLLRSALLTTPIIPDDFRREEYSLIVGALIPSVAPRCCSMPKLLLQRKYRGSLQSARSL